MFNRISQKLSDQFEQQGIISSDEKELYRYGLRQGFTILLNILSVALIGWMLDALVECCIYLIAYTVLRIFAGGYHARTPIRCYLFFITMVTACLLVIKYLPLTDLICCVLFSIGIVCVFLLAPVEDKNKPLDEIERQVYRKRTYIVLFVELLVFSISMTNHLLMLCLPISCAVASIAILMIAGYFKNKTACKHDTGKSD